MGVDGGGMCLSTPFAVEILAAPLEVGGRDL